MSKLGSGFDMLVQTLLDCADHQDKLLFGDLYASGKAVAYREAAKWLRKEIDFYEQEESR